MKLATFGQKLVTFGCSLTYGTGLSDCWDGSVSGSVPSKLAWPEILRRLMKIKIVNNFSNPGASNKEIAYLVLKQLSKGTIKQDDVVIIQWTYLNRQCIVKEDNTIQLFPYPTVRPDTEAVSENRMSRAFYEHIHDDYDMMYQTSTNHNYIYHKLKQLNIKQFHMRVDLKTESAFEWADTPFLDTNFPRIRNLYPRALDNRHPGEQAHMEIAKRIYEEVKEKIQ